MLSWFLVGFVAGICAILSFELLVVLFVLNLLNRKIKQRIKKETHAADAAVRNPQDSFDSICNLQGKFQRRSRREKGRRWRFLLLEDMLKSKMVI